MRPKNGPNASPDSGRSFSFPAAPCPAVPASTRRPGRGLWQAGLLASAAVCEPTLDALPLSLSLLVRAMGLWQPGPPLLQALQRCVSASRSAALACLLRRRVALSPCLPKEQRARPSTHFSQQRLHQTSLPHVGNNITAHPLRAPSLPKPSLPKPSRGDVRLTSSESAYRSRPAPNSAVTSSRLSRLRPKNGLALRSDFPPAWIVSRTSFPAAAAGAGDADCLSVPCPRQPTWLSARVFLATRCLEEHACAPSGTRARCGSRTN